MEWEFKDHSWMAKFYRWSYGKDAYSHDDDGNRIIKMPESLCNYSRDLFIAFIALPLTAPSQILQHAAKNDNWNYALEGRSILGLCLYCFVALFGFLAYEIYMHPMKSMIMTSILLGVVALFFLVMWIRNWAKRGISSFPKSEVYKIAKGTVYAIKNKVCPKIKWVEKSE